MNELLRGTRLVGILAFVAVCAVARADAASDAAGSGILPVPDYSSDIL